jgi:hypothetical protein
MDKLDLLIEEAHGKALLEDAKRTPKPDMVEEVRRFLEEDIHREDIQHDFWD